MLSFKQIKAFGYGQVDAQVLLGPTSPITSQGVEPALFAALRASSCAMEIPQRTHLKGSFQMSAHCLPVSTLAFHLHGGFNEMPNGCLRNKVLPSGSAWKEKVTLCMERKGRDSQGGDIPTEHIRGAGEGGGEGDSFRVSLEFSFQLCLSAGSVTLGKSLHLCKSCLGLFCCTMGPQYLPARVWGLTERLHGASCLAGNWSLAGNYSMESLES